MDNGRVQEYTIFLDFEKNFAHARAKCTRLSFLSGCDRKRRTPRKETGYEAKDLAYPAQTDTHTHLLGSKACTSVSLLVPKFHVTCRDRIGMEGIRFTPPM